jgi:uncharacterized membrane protein
MDKTPSLEERLLQLTSQLSRLEDLVQRQTQRIYALERQLDNTRTSFPSSQPEIPPETGSTATAMEESTGPRDAPSGLSNTQFAPFPAAESIESRIGGNLLNKIGMVAIVLGMAYFLKYAIDNQWIGETGRVVLGMLSGLGFLYGGEWLRQKGYWGYALTLLGGGISILYFSVFAAYNFYRLLDQLPSFGLMLLITITAVLMALRYDSKSIAYLGLIGGFLTPVMLSTGRDNQVGLFCYIALLDLGILALAYFKNWRSLNLTAFLLTQLIFLGWTSSFYTPAKLWRTEFFLSLFFILFAIVAFLYNIVHQQRTSLRDLVLILFNGAAYFLWTYSLLESRYFGYLGLYAVLMAAFYVGLSLISFRRARQDDYLFLALLGAAFTSLTLAIPIQLKQNWITIGWSVEAAVLAWIGFQLKHPQTRWAALCISALVAVRLLFYEVPIYTAPAGFFLLNQRSLAFVVGILSMLTMAYGYAIHRRKWMEPASEEETYQQRLWNLEVTAMTVLILLANLLWVYLVTTEIGSFFERQYLYQALWEVRRSLRSQMQLAISAFWASYSIILVTIGILRRYQPIRLMAILLFGITIVKVFLVDLSELERVYRIISFIGLGIILLIVSFMYQKYKQEINSLVMK